jgi:DNA repair protein RecO (recombination protein O)
MPVRETEAIILRTYPFREADRIVSFLSREEGRTRGVAPNARRSQKRFGAALELLSHVRVRFRDHGARDLVRVESCELIESFFDIQGDYDVAIASSYLAEVCEQLLPEREANDPFFRLVLLVMSEIGRTRRIWRPLTYFDLWAVRLAGFLPPLSSCARCGAALGADQPVWFRPQWEGTLCAACRGEESWPLKAESRALANLMLTTPLLAIDDEGWNKEQAADLRRFLNQQMERHLDRRFVTRPHLESLS